MCLVQRHENLGKRFLRPCAGEFKERYMVGYSKGKDRVGAFLRSSAPQGGGYAPRMA